MQVEDNWQTVKWRTMEYLQYLGLEPWYLREPHVQQFAQDPSSGTLSDVVMEPEPNITLKGGSASILYLAEPVHV